MAYPKYKRLESLVNSEESDSSTWLIAQGFTNVQSHFYWSSTTDAAVTNTTNAFGVFMSYGNVVSAVKSSSTVFTWPVRSGSGGSSVNSDVWKTGQTSCYSVIDCEGTGQDGETQAGVAWPSPRFTDNGDSTVTDNPDWSRVDTGCQSFRWRNDLAGGT